MRRIIAFGPAMVVLMTTAVVLFAAPAVLQRLTHTQTQARIQLARDVLDDDDILARIDRAVAAVAEATLPSIVHIEAAGRGAGATGAGWVYDELGHIVTNAHVVRSAGRLAVEFSDGRAIRAELVGADPYTDIAVLKVDAVEGLFPAVRATGRFPTQGQRVFAFGSPFSYKFSMSQGIVSGVGRDSPGGIGTFGQYTNFIQTDAAVNPGNSGGPLVDVRAEVVGMNVAIATARGGGELDESTGDSAGISFAIPLGTIEPIVAQLITYGEVRRGFLGIVYNGTSIDRVSVGGEVRTGVRITVIEEGAPSDLAGLAVDDVIVEVDDSPIVSPESLSALISSVRPGEAITLGFVRDGELRELDVVLGNATDLVLAQRVENPAQFRLGALVDDTERGAELVRVWPGTLADQSGLGVGDRVVSVDGESIADRTAFFAALFNAGLLEGDSVAIDFEKRDGDRVTLEFSLYGR